MTKRKTKTYRIAVSEYWSGELFIESRFEATSDVEALQHFLVDNEGSELLLLDPRGWNIHLDADDYRNCTKEICKDQFLMNQKTDSTDGIPNFILRR